MLMVRTVASLISLHTRWATRLATSTLHIKLKDLRYLQVLTNWTLEGTPGYFDISRGTGSQWATAGTAWACCCFYIWVAIAPAVFPNRDFH